MQPLVSRAFRSFTVLADLQVHAFKALLINSCIPKDNLQQLHYTFAQVSFQGYELITGRFVVHARLRFLPLYIAWPAQCGQRPVAGHALAQRLSEKAGVF